MHLSPIDLEVRNIVIANPVRNPQGALGPWLWHMVGRAITAKLSYRCLGVSFSDSLHALRVAEHEARRTQVCEQRPVGNPLVYPWAVSERSFFPISAFSM